MQIWLGGLVAGIDAGLASNTWPLMNGALVPEGLLALSPWWLNLFENPLTVQFDHRLFGYLVWLVALAHVATALRGGGGAASRRAGLIFGLMTVQVALGVATVILMVPMDVALAHQLTGGLLVAVAAWHAQRSLLPAAGKQEAMPAAASAPAH